MNEYEITFIVNPDKEEETGKVLDSVKGFIEKKKGKIKDVDEWGLKKLAYSIHGYGEGYYTVMNFGLSPDKIDLLRDFIQKNEDILRYILVSKEE
ncbi:30S ribosomal protein S6 [candidate division WOR-3 bacterium]|jgi:small subunit ribosomal protein S6|nr:30S ribosomal protein S6 [candidate division WOR-3 bacterium]